MSAGTAAFVTAAAAAFLITLVLVGLRQLYNLRDENDDLAIHNYQLHVNLEAEHEELQQLKRQLEEEVAWHIKDRDELESANRHNAWLRSQISQYAEKITSLQRTPAHTPPPAYPDELQLENAVLRRQLTNALATIHAQGELLEEKNRLLMAVTFQQLQQLYRHPN